MLRRGRGLRPGVNQVFVKTRDYKDFDRVEFIVARRAPKLLRLTDLDVDGRGAPVRVEVATRGDATPRAWVNGHRVDRAFHPQGRGYVGRLGANDWVRPGRNRLVVLVHRAHRSGRSAAHDVESTTFRVRGVIAGAGRDRVVDAGDFIELRGSAAGARGDRDYDWAIVDAPDGGDEAVLKHAQTATPEFKATTPGRYRIRATARTANDTSSADSAANDATSADTVTVTVRADVPPIGWNLQVGFSPKNPIRLNGPAVPGTTTCLDPASPDLRCSLGYPTITWAIFNRQTLELVTSGTFYFEARDLPVLAALAADYSKREPSYLMVVTASFSKLDDSEWVKLLNTLGVGDKSAARDPSNAGPVSIVGVPGSPAGSAFVSAPYCRTTHCGTLPLVASGMLGYLRLNPASGTGGLFEFVRTDQTQFNTAASTEPGQVRMTVGSQSFTGRTPTDGSSGFFLVTLDSQRLTLRSQDVFVTNGPDGSQNPSGEASMAAALAAAVEGDNRYGRALVMLQAFGTPHGDNASWRNAGTAIQKLGGSAQVFVQLNQGTRDERFSGRYALVGRAAMGPPAAESSQPLSGKPSDGMLRGLLARANDDAYFPLIADPTGSINFDLVNIVNRPMARNGGFDRYTGGMANAEEYLGRNVMKVCSSYEPRCDVRAAYQENIFGTIWPTILVNLATTNCATAADQSNGRFTKEDCETVRAKLYEEVGARNAVADYFEGLQRPFGAAQVTALVDIAQISDQIQRDVKPPDAVNATSHALNIVNYLVKIVGAAGGVANPTVGTAANGIAAGFGLAAYLTHDNGTPDVIGPEVKARATDLGVQLTNPNRAVGA